MVLPVSFPPSPAANGGSLGLTEETILQGGYYTENAIPGPCVEVDDDSEKRIYVPIS